MTCYNSTRNKKKNTSFQFSPIGYLQKQQRKHQVPTLIDHRPSYIINTSLERERETERGGERERERGHKRVKLCLPAQDNR